MNAPATAMRQGSRLRRTLRWVGVGLLVLLVIMGLTAAWVWSHRYQLIERQAITYLKSQGIEADLSIRSASRTAADIRSIRLSQNGERFLSVDRLEAEYQWRDLLSGRVERLAFSGLNAIITINETGQIVDGWMPPSNGEDGGGLPPNGITIDRGAIELHTPYGRLPISGDATIQSVETFYFDGTLAPTTLIRDGIEADLGGDISVQREDTLFDINAPDIALSLTHPSATLRNTRLGTQATFDLETNVLKGELSLSGGEFSAQAGLEGRIERIALQGQFEGGALEANLNTDLRALRVPDEARRRSVAETLSLANALSDVPVAQNFAPSLITPLTDLLANSDLSADLSLSLSDTQRTIILRAPMTVTGAETEAVLRPIKDTPFYSYTPGKTTYRVQTDASLNRPLPLTLSPLDITVRTKDGLAVLGVERARGTAKTRRDWRTETRDGRPVRLGPLSIDFDYAAPLEVPSTFNLRGTADYDGDIPGGYVEGLSAGGRLSAVQSETRTRIDFAPDRPIRFDHLETTSDWVIDDFNGVLDPQRPLLDRRSGQPMRVVTRLTDATFTANRPETDQAEAAALNLSIKQADLKGAIDGARQDWTIDFVEMGLQSETFPVPGTNLSLPNGTLTVGLSAQNRTDFTLTTPSSTVLTPAYAVRGMALNVAGTAEDYTLDFQSGRVEIIPHTESATPLPILPASGSLTFRNDEFTGQAQSYLPAAPDSPFEINYRLSDAGGEADIAIRDLRFRPGGLQPQDLAPTLRGKIARVDGSIDADLSVRFGGDNPISGSGTVYIPNLNFGTAPGPVTGLSGTVELTSLFPVVTAPNQSLSIQGFDPGFPFENGSVQYQLASNGVDIQQATFPLGDGQVSFDPFTWIYGAEENRVTLRVSGVQIGDYLRDIGEGQLTATGIIEGTIPVVVRGLDVRVEHGRVEVPNGGTIRYVSDNPNQNMALKALENFRYQELFAEVDGPLDGNVMLGMEFTGSNPDILFDVPFEFDVTVEGELFNIARSLNPNGLQQRVINSVTSQVRGEPTE